MTVDPVRGGRYARVERERRFLVTGPPDISTVVAQRRIVDRYLTGTRLRLRHQQRTDTGAEEYKLTQKIPVDASGPVQGWITTIYLSRVEYEILFSVAADMLAKTRLSVPPIGVDVFAGPLLGLIMAEAEFASDESAAAFAPPPNCVAEVTDDPRFTGGRLSRATRQELSRWLDEYGVPIDRTSTGPP